MLGVDRAERCDCADSVTCSALEMAAAISSWTKKTSEFAVESLGPQVVAVRGVDQLGRDANSVPGAPHAAFEHRAHVQRPGDGPDVLGVAAKRERGGPRRDLQILNPGERVDDLLGESIAEVFILRVGAQVGERQHCD